MAHHRVKRNLQRRLLQSILRQAKAGVTCVDCGLRGPHPALQFDHEPERGPKTADLHEMIRDTVNVAEFRAELAKGRWRCANCHILIGVLRRIRLTGEMRLDLPARGAGHCRTCACGHAS